MRDLDPAPSAGLRGILSELQLGIALLRALERERPGTFLDFDAVLHHRTQTRKEIDFVGPPGTREVDDAELAEHFAHDRIKVPGVPGGVLDGQADPHHEKSSLYHEKSNTVARPARGLPGDDPRILPPRTANTYLQESPISDGGDQPNVGPPRTNAMRDS